MSCYLYIGLKKKDVPTNEFLLMLMHLCTTPARALSDGLEEFAGETYLVTHNQEDPQYGHYKKLSTNLLDKTLEYYQSKIQEYKDSKVKYEKELNDAKELYVNAKTKLVLDDIKETIHDSEEMIQWCDEQIEEYNALYYLFLNSVYNVLDENKTISYDKDRNVVYGNEYELVYYMG